MFEVINKYKDEIESLYKSGLSIRKVAQTLNLKTGTVAAYIKYIGLSRNDFTGRNNPFYGKTHSEKFKLEHSRRMKGRKPPNKGKSKYGEGIISRLLIEVWRNNATKRNIDFEITPDDIDSLWKLQSGKCALTSRDMSLNYNSNKFYRVSLDRIDSTIGYTATNIQLVVGIVNIMKNTLQNEEFISICKEVADAHG